MKRTFLFWNKNLSLNLIKSSSSIFSRVIIVIVIIFFFENLLFSQQEDTIIPAQFIYPGDELGKFIKDNIVRPYGCQQYGINADVEVSFTVDTLGNVSNLQVVSFKPLVHEYNDYTYEDYKAYYFNKPGHTVWLKNQNQEGNLDSSFIKEAFRLIQFTNGLWKPAQINLKSIQSEMVLTILFKSDTFIRTKHKTRMNMTYSEVEYQWAIGDEMQRQMNELLVKKEMDTPSNDPKKYYQLGVDKFIQKKYLLAHKYFTASVSYDPFNRDGWYDLGVTNYILKKMNDACDCWQKALDMGIEETKQKIEKYCK